MRRMRALAARGRGRGGGPEGAEVRFGAEGDEWEEVALDRLRGLGEDEAVEEGERGAEADEHAEAGARACGGVSGKESKGADDFSGA